MIIVDPIKKKSLDDKKRRKEIIDRLEKIDIKTIRPLRNGETSRLQELEAEAQTLRIELDRLK